MSDNITIEHVVPESQQENEPVFGTWLNLNLSEQKKSELVDKIIKEIEQIKADRTEIESRIKQYRNMYDQIVEETSMPFPGAFNLNVPLCPKNVDATVAQTEEAFENVDPKWVIQTPVRKDRVPMRDFQEKVLDFYSDVDMEETDAWEHVYHDAFLLGTGWLACTFKTERIRVRDFVVYRSPEQFVEDFKENDEYLNHQKHMNRLLDGEEVRLVVEKNQIIYRNVKPEHVEWEDVIVPLNTNGIDGLRKARIIARYVPKRWEEIYNDEQQDDYNKGMADKLMYKVAEDGSSTEAIDPDYMKHVYDTYEVIYFVDIDKDRIEERCLFNIEVSHRLMLRDIRYPYNHNRPYLIPYNIQKTRKGIYQPGLGEKLLYLNIALNAIINHTLNASVIANSLSLKVRTATDAVKALYEHQWYPGSILELMNLSDVEQFTFNTPNLNSLINLFAIVERFGEDVSGIVNYALGQESEEDPQAPASKTIALMRKAEIKLRRYIKNLKRSNNEAGYQSIQLMKQFLPREEVADVMGVTIEEVNKMFDFPMKTITQASGFAIEKMFEKRDDIQMTQMLLQDPMVAQDEIRRARLYRIISKEWGSNWDKKIEDIVPTEQELVQAQQQAIQQQQQKKQQVVREAVRKAIREGASVEEAADIGRSAGRNLDALAQQQEQGNG